MKERLIRLNERYREFREESVTDFVDHYDAVENEGVRKRYARDMELFRERANNPNLSPGRKRAYQEVVKAWDEHQRIYGDAVSRDASSELDELSRQVDDLQD